VHGRTPVNRSRRRVIHSAHACLCLISRLLAVAYAQWLIVLHRTSTLLLTVLYRTSTQWLIALYKTSTSASTSSSAFTRSDRLQTSAVPKCLATPPACGNHKEFDSYLSRYGRTEVGIVTLPYFDHANHWGHSLPSAAPGPSP
jgi:hypothetical protein